MKKTNYCRTFILILAWVSVIAGAFCACYIVENPSLGITGLCALVSSPFMFGFAKIVKAAHLYIEKCECCDDESCEDEEK